MDIIASVPWQCSTNTLPQDPRRAAIADATMNIPSATEVPDIQGDQGVPMVLHPLPPSSDWAKLQQRVSELRVALEHSNAVASNYQQQVAGLTENLQAKHQENSYLQLQLVEAAQNIQLLDGNAQGHLSIAQGAVVSELQQELRDSTQRVWELEQMVQQLQFELHTCGSSATGALAAEHAERERAATELGQARLLASARLRHIDSITSQLESSKQAQDVLQKQLEQQAASAQQAAADAAAHADELQQELQVCQQQIAQLQTELSEEREAGGELGAQFAQAQTYINELRTQNEWLEAAVSDLQSGSTSAANFAQLQAELRRMAVAKEAEHGALQQQVQRLQAELQATHEQLHEAHQQLAAQASHPRKSTDRCDATTQVEESEAVSAPLSSQGVSGMCEPGEGAQQGLDTHQGAAVGAGAHSWAARVAELTHRLQEMEQQVGQEQDARAAAQAEAQCLQQVQAQLEAEVQQLRASSRGGNPGGGGGATMGALGQRSGAAGVPEAPDIARKPSKAWAEAFGFSDGEGDGCGDSDGVGGTLCDGAPVRPAVVDAEVQTSEPAALQGAPPATTSPGHRALLEAAKQEVRRLAEVNAALLEESNSMRARMVPIEDVRKALADARVTSRTKMEEALASAGASWGARAAALEARLADAEDRTQAAQAQVQAAEARAQAAEARLAQARQEAEEAVCQAEEAVGAATEAQQREAGSRAEAEAARKKTEELLCTVAELETRAVQAEAALQAATAQHEAAQGDLDKAKQQVEEVQAMLHTQQAKSEELVRQLRAAQDQADQARLEAEADAAATIMDAAAAADRRENAVRRQVESLYLGRLQEAEDKVQQLQLRAAEAVSQAAAARAALEGARREQAQGAGMGSALHAHGAAQQPLMFAAATQTQGPEVIEAAVQASPVCRSSGTSTGSPGLTASAAIQTDASSTATCGVQVCLGDASVNTSISTSTAIVPALPAPAAAPTLPPTALAPFMPPTVNALVPAGIRATMPAKGSTVMTSSIAAASQLLQEIRANLGTAPATASNGGSGHGARALRNARPATALILGVMGSEVENGGHALGVAAWSARPPQPPPGGEYGWGQGAGCADRALGNLTNIQTSSLVPSARLGAAVPSTKPAAATNLHPHPHHHHHHQQTGFAPKASAALTLGISVPQLVAEVSGDVVVLATSSAATTPRDSEGVGAAMPASPTSPASPAAMVAAQCPGALPASIAVSELSPMAVKLCVALGTPQASDSPALPSAGGTAGNHRHSRLRSRSSFGDSQRSEASASDEEQEQQQQAFAGSGQGVFLRTGAAAPLATCQQTTLPPHETQPAHPGSYQHRLLPPPLLPPSAGSGVSRQTSEGSGSGGRGGGGGRGARSPHRRASEGYQSTGALGGLIGNVMGGLDTARLHREMSEAQAQAAAVKARCALEQTRAALTLGTLHASTAGRRVTGEQAAAIKSDKSKAKTQRGTPVMESSVNMSLSSLTTMAGHRAAQVSANRRYVSDT